MKWRTVVLMAVATFTMFGAIITVDGDHMGCRKYLGEANRALHQLRNLNKTGVYALKDRKFNDGTVLSASSVGGQDYVKIHKPLVGGKERVEVVEQYAIALFTYYLSEADYTNYDMFTGVYRDGKWQKLSDEETPLPYFKRHTIEGYYNASGWTNNDAHMAFHPKGVIATVIPATTLVFSGGALVQVSKDFGKNWNDVAFFPTTNANEAYVSIEVSRNGTLYLLVSTVFCDDGDNRYYIYKSVDKGDSFQLINTVQQVTDEWTENPSLAVTNDSWLFGGTANQMFVNNNGTVTYYGNVDTGSPYATGSFVPNPSITDVYGASNALPQMGISDSGTLCWVDSVRHTEIRYATPYQIGGVGPWFVQNPFTGEVSEEVSANAWSPASIDPLTGTIHNWTDRPSFTNNPVEFIKQDEHSCILRNGVKVWDAPFNTVFAYWGAPSEIRADGRTWVASFMNMNSEGVYGAEGDTWGVLTSTNDGATWSVKEVTGSTIFTNGSTLGGKCSVDIAGSRIVAAITQINKLQVYLSENKGGSFKTILDKTSQAGFSFSNFLMSPVRIVDLPETRRIIKE